MRLGDMLIKAGVVNDLQLNAAIAEQSRWGGKLGQVLVRMGALSEDLLVMALCRQLSLPRADLAAIQTINESLKERIDQQTCERYRVLPLGYVAERKAIQLAMSDPFDVVALDDLSRRLGTRIEPFLAGDEALATAIRRLYTAAGSNYLAASENLDFIDNGGNPREATGMFTVPPAALAAVTVIPGGVPGPAPSLPLLQQMQQMQQVPSDLPARVDEQQRFVRAIADLLVERGVIHPDELRRR